jgi:hypothetical protein
MLGLSAINDHTRQICPCCKLNKVSYVSNYKYCVACYDLYIQKKGGVECQNNQKITLKQTKPH